MKVAITLNKSELVTIAETLESNTFKKAFKNVTDKKLKKTSFSPLEAIKLQFGKEIERTYGLIEIKFSKTQVTLTGDVNIVKEVTALIETLSDQKTMVKAYANLSKSINKKQLKGLNGIINALQELAVEVKFNHLMGY